MSDELVANEIERLADRLVGAWTAEVEVPTMLDRFAIALVGGIIQAAHRRNDRGPLAFLPDLNATGRADFARAVYDLADALDAERRRRNEEDGR